VDRERLIIWLALVVAVGWFVSLMADILVKEYEPPAAVHAIMMAAVTAVLGREFIKRVNGGKNGSTA
jgi:hypothetical protein